MIEKVYDEEKIEKKEKREKMENDRTIRSGLISGVDPSSTFPFYSPLAGLA
jgi:hypothetical protein